MAERNSTATTAISMPIKEIDVEMAIIALNANCDALSAIANAVEILSSLNPSPEDLFSNTITRLMSHAIYLADSTKEDIGIFFEEVHAKKGGAA